MKLEGVAPVHYVGFHWGLVLGLLGRAGRKHWPVLHSKTTNPALSALFPAAASLYKLHKIAPKANNCKREAQNCGGIQCYGSRSREAKDPVTGLWVIQ